MPKNFYYPTKNDEILHFPRISIKVTKGKIREYRNVNIELLIESLHISEKFKNKIEK